LTASESGGKGKGDAALVAEDFLIETKDLKANEAKENAPQEVRVEIRYQPSRMSELRAVLALNSPDGGDYKTMLVGYAQPPQPQGPVQISNKKPEAVEFRNPFHEAVEFTVSIDNPADFVLKVPTKNKIDPGKPLSIGVEFKGQKAAGSRLIVTCEQMTTPWIYFLKGTMG